MSKPAKPEPMPHTSHDWKEESNPVGWHGEIGCAACGLAVGEPGTYDQCPAGSPSRESAQEQVNRTFSDEHEHAAPPPAGA